jgi:hypothetical protein
MFKTIWRHECSKQFEDMYAQSNLKTSTFKTIWRHKRSMCLLIKVEQGDVEEKCF